MFTTEIHVNTTLPLFAWPYPSNPGASGAPVTSPGLATPAVGVTGGVASALVSSTSSPSPSTPAVTPWIFTRLAHRDLNHGPIANYFQHLAQENTAKAKPILAKADQVADALGLDDELLGGLVAGLTS